MDLFSSAAQYHTQPLAHRMRPRYLDEYIGQDHIIGKGRLLRRAIQADQLSSIIFYGPPGTGKTTLARVIANTTKSRFTTMNAVLSGVKELREEISHAKDRLDLHGMRTILFVDEVHRWNKSQQDALLPWVENGTVILIGATTENPYFEVNSALVSRSRIFQLKKLTAEDLFRIAKQALGDRERGYGKYKITFSAGALEHIVDIANGDARSLLNALQLAVETTPDQFPPPEGEGAEIHITLEAAEESIQKKVVLYDKEGDYHFDVISAFIKSIRGSDPDAALYWLARMVRAGEEPRYIFRRMLISASEDIGLADPNALTVVSSAADAFDRIGLPEGRFHLTQAALYLATAPKSNSTLGFFDALKSVEQEQDSEVPNHLKDKSRDSEGFGHGKGYLYPHAYQDHWVAQQYLPGAVQGKIFYQPGEMGYEKQLRDDVLKRREAQLEAALEESSEEILTFSPPDKFRDQWLQRIISGKGEKLSDIRERIFSNLILHRHDRVLVPEAGSGMLVWEAARRTPEGGVYGFSSAEQQFRLIEHHLQQLPAQERPVITQCETKEGLTSLIAEKLSFEAAAGYNLLTRLPERSDLLPLLHDLLAEGGTLSLAQAVPSLSGRLSRLISRTSPAFSYLAEAENLLYGESSHSANWNAEELLEIITQAGFSEVSSVAREYREQRMISEEDVVRWVTKTYEPLLPLSQKTAPGIDTRESLITILKRELCTNPVSWETVILFVRGKKGT